MFLWFICECHATTQRAINITQWTNGWTKCDIVTGNRTIRIMCVCVCAKSKVWKTLNCKHSKWSQQLPWCPTKARKSQFARCNINQIQSAIKWIAERVQWQSTRSLDAPLCNCLSYRRACDCVVSNANADIYRLKSTHCGLENNTCAARAKQLCVSAQRHRRHWQRQQRICIWIGFVSHNHMNQA